MKEEIIKGIMSQGYDLLSAAEMATKAIDEFKSQEKKSITYSVGKYTFTIKRK